MAGENTEHFTVPALEALPGEGELSALELSYLHAAGIDPHLLNAMDRADVIRLLVMHPERIENPRIGDVAALLYRFGLLEEMLEGDTDDDDDKQEKKEQKFRERADQMFCEMKAMPPGEYAGKYPLPAGFPSVSDLAKLGIALDEDPAASPDKPDKTPKVARPAKEETESSSSPRPATGDWVAAVTEKTDSTTDSLKK